MDQVGLRHAAITVLLMSGSAEAQPAAEEGAGLLGTCTRLIVRGVDRSDLCIDRLEQRRIGGLNHYVFALSDGTTVGFLVPTPPTAAGSGGRWQGAVTGVSVGRIDAAAEPATGVCSLSGATVRDIVVICRAVAETGVFEGTFRGSKGAN